MRYFSGSYKLKRFLRNAVHFFSPSPHLRICSSPIILICLVLVFTGYAAGGAEGLSRPDRTTLVVGTPSAVRTLDPAVAIDNAAWKISYYCYDRLVQYDGVTTDLIPMAATQWEISEDGLHYTFHLRDDIFFHDGTKLDAYAVKFSLLRVLTMDAGPAADMTAIDSIEIIDDHRLTISLKHPFPPFVSILATNGANIVNPRVMDHEIDQEMVVRYVGDLGHQYLSDRTMGSGPFQFLEKRDGTYVLTAFDRYWDGPPALDTVKIMIVPKADERVRLIQEGYLDIAEGLLPRHLDSLLESPDIVVEQNQTMAFNYLYINTRHEPLDSMIVRQALNYAVDRGEIIEQVAGGLGEKVYRPLPAGLWDIPSTHPGYHFNPDLTAELLAQAGLQDGFTVTLLYSNYRPYWENQVQIIKDQLARFNITVELAYHDWPELRERVDEGAFDLCVGIWSPDYADPFMFLNYWYDSDNFGLKGNRAFYQNDQVDTWLREAAQTTDVPQRIELYSQVMDTVLEEAPYILLFKDIALLAIQKTVTGYAYHPMLNNMHNFPTMSKQ